MVDKNALKFSDLGQKNEVSLDEEDVRFDAQLMYEVVSDKDIHAQVAGGLDLFKGKPIKVSGILAEILINGSEHIKLVNKKAEIAKVQDEIKEAEMEKRILEKIQDSVTPKTSAPTSKPKTKAKTK